MFNFLAPFDEKNLDGFIKEGNRYFVRQTFNKAKDPFDIETRGHFLFCHYKEYAQAKEHFDVLMDDPNRYLYDWEDSEHREKLKVAASKPRGYKLFTNTFIPDWERHITDKFKSKVKAYIQSLGWKPGRNDSVKFDFFPRFGEPHISLRFKNREVHVTFDDIENLY